MRDSLRLAVVGALVCVQLHLPAKAQSPAELADMAAARDYKEAPVIEFDETQHVSFLPKGRAGVLGEAFLRQQGGGLVTCAGSSVSMFPATPYFVDAVVDGRFVVGSKPRVMPPSAKAMIRQAQCDSSGSFIFDDVPSGDYMIMTEVVWTVGQERQGGGLLKRVRVDDSILKVSMSDQDFKGR